MAGLRSGLVNEGGSRSGGTPENFQASRRDRWSKVVGAFILVIIVIVGISRRCRAARDGDNLVDATCPLLLQTPLKLYGIYDHVVFLLSVLKAGRDHVPRRAQAPNTSQQVSGIGGYA